MNDRLKVYQFNLNKCLAAQANLMVELMNFKDKQFICLLQEPHFQGLNPSSIDNKTENAFSPTLPAMLFHRERNCKMLQKTNAVQN